MIAIATVIMTKLNVIICSSDNINIQTEKERDSQVNGQFRCLVATDQTELNKLSVI